MIADAGGKLRTVRGPADLQAGQNHHVAVTWDFPKAHLQLFVDGKLIAANGPHDAPWPSSLVPDDKTRRARDRHHGNGPPQHADASVYRRRQGLQRRRVERKRCWTNCAFRMSCVTTAISSPPAASFRPINTPGHCFISSTSGTGCMIPTTSLCAGTWPASCHDSKKRCRWKRFRTARSERRMVSVKPRCDELFEENRVENRLMVTRPFGPLPDPRFVEYRPRQRSGLSRPEDQVPVGSRWRLRAADAIGHLRAGEDSPEETTLLPRWRANDNVVPFSAESLAATLAADVTDDEEKALEVMRYALATSNYYDAHFCETLPTRHRSRVSYSLIKAVNIYAFDQCGPLNYTLRKLFLTAGISSNDASGTHHQFEQAFYGGSWRLFDLSPRKYWLNRDNTTVAGRRAFEDDLYLKLRQGDGVNSGIQGRVSRARFGSAERPHSMDFPLRAGERASICWHNEGRWFEITGDRQPISLAKVPPYFGNGAIVYEPTGAGEATVLENAEIRKTADDATVLYAMAPDQAATLVYRAQCPYIFSDATVDGAFAGDAAAAIPLSISFDAGKSWTEVWRSTERSGQFSARLLKEVTGRYAYWLKVNLAANSGATIRGLKVRTTLVASPLALPGKLARGENRISFVGASPTVPVTTTCRWTERHQSTLGVSLARSATT